MLRGFSILLLFQLAGEALTRVAGWPVPGPVVGMALLLAALQLRARLRTTFAPRSGAGEEAPAGEGLEAVASGLLSHLSLLFVPAGVGVMLHARRLAAEWPAILGALLVSTGAAVAVTALVAERLGRRARGRGEGRA